MASFASSSLDGQYVFGIFLVTSSQTGVHLSLSLSFSILMDLTVVYLLAMSASMGSTKSVHTERAGGGGDAHGRVADDEERGGEGTGMEKKEQKMKRRLGDGLVECMCVLT